MLEILSPLFQNQSIPVCRSFAFSTVLLLSLHFLIDDKVSRHVFPELLLPLPVPFSLAHSRSTKYTQGRLLLVATPVSAGSSPLAAPPDTFKDCAF